jgi:hypothetical protein
VVKLAKATSGNTIRNTGEMRRTVTEEPRTNSAANEAREEEAALAVVAEPGEPVVLAGLVELAAQVVQEALAELVDQAVLAALAASAELVVREALAELVVREALVELVNREALAELVVREAPEELVNREALAELVVREAPEELELVPVAVLQARIRSVTAAHRHGQVPVPKRVEDMAVAVAEIMREPAATEAAVVWAAVE